MSDDAELVRIAEQLCAVPPADFTAARTAAASDTSDRGVAAAVAKLRKPVLAAWVVNVLARERGDLLASVLGIAEQLREALEAGDAAELKALTAQRRATLRALVDAAVDVASSHDVAVSAAARGGVERTLDAALRDPDAAAAVSTGRLLRPLEASGMEAPDLTDAVAGPFAPAASAPPSDELAERRAAREAERAAREAARVADAADRDLARAEERRATARAAVARLEERLEDLDAERERIRGAVQDARDAADAADAAHRDARTAAGRARAAAERASLD
ncbi:hypothetical protein [Microbacterium dauci]|uniref:Transposase n=1 Tax=Microbacterium dauci TaxID=3048008 RepID=A0ABT6ZAG1_9MICO|nr:hypothetical protein [Microbacterium sp. LX3-4]MDJ1113144.1 hypothetical protein [Microbacterium sp. LX3-4]